MSANFTISSANEIQHHQQDIANSVFCFALGTITKINQASPDNVNIANIVQVKLGYKLQNYSIIKDEAIIDCLAIQQIHHPVSYKVGDKVWIAFTDTPQHNFLLHNICDIYNIEQYNQAHHLCNGIILCNISPFTSERNNQVGLVTDKSSLLFTDLDGAETLEVKTPKATISIDESGNVTIDTQGKISIKNSSSSLKTILDEFNTKIKAGFTSVDASAPTSGWVNPPQGATSYGDLASIISQLLQ